MSEKRNLLELELMAENMKLKIATMKCSPKAQAPTESEGPCESTEPELPEECAEFKAKLEGYIRVFKNNDCDDEDSLHYALCALNVRNEFF